MIKIIGLAVFLIAFTDAVYIKNCRSSLPVQLSLQKFPDPLYIRPGGEIKFSGKAVIKTKTPSRIKVTVKIQKKMLFWITVPCVKDFGSCTYYVGCNDLRKGGYKGDCPAGPGTHALKDFVIKLPNIKLPSFLANGQYYLSADVRDASNNKQYACGSMYLNIRS